MKRRKFLKTLSTGTFLALNLNFNFTLLQAAEKTKTLSEAFQSAGFSPTENGSAFFVVTADLHYAEKHPEHLQVFRELTEEIRGMNPAPIFLTALGDLICSRSHSFGSMGNEAAALKEWGMLKADLEKFPKNVPLKLIPGNHDTQPGEIDAKLCCETLGIRPYYAFQANGIHFIFLNGGHDAFLDPAQRRWLKAEIEKVPAEAEIVLAIHQPMGVSNERGLAMVLPSYLEKHTGPVYLLAGHEHVDFETAHQLPRTCLHEFVHSVVDGGWQFQGLTYWIYCTKDGHITARVRRNPDGTFSVFPKFSERLTAKAKPILQPFGAIPKEEILLSATMGDEDGKLKVHSLTGGNCFSYVFYLKEITVSLELPENASRFAILGRLNSSLNGKGKQEDYPRRVFVSANGTEKKEVQLISRLPGDSYIFPIPEELRKQKELFIHIESWGYKTNDVFAGAAILS